MRDKDQYSDTQNSTPFFWWVGVKLFSSSPSPLLSSQTSEEENEIKNTTTTTALHHTHTSSLLILSWSLRALFFSSLFGYMAACSSGTSSTSGTQFRSRFGDTTYTKVFVGGLAWETQTEELHKYFAQFGDILESVIITDRFTGRSKGYGFVSKLTFSLIIFILIT